MKAVTTIPVVHWPELVEVLRPNFRQRPETGGTLPPIESEPDSHWALGLCLWCEYREQPVLPVGDLETNGLHVPIQACQQHLEWLHEWACQLHSRLPPPVAPLAAPTPRASEIGRVRGRHRAPSERS